MLIIPALPNGHLVQRGPNTWRFLAALTMLVLLAASVFADNAIISGSGWVSGQNYLRIKRSYSFRTDHGNEYISAWKIDLQCVESNEGIPCKNYVCNLYISYSINTTAADILTTGRFAFGAWSDNPSAGTRRSVYYHPYFAPDVPHADKLDITISGPTMGQELLIDWTLTPEWTSTLPPSPPPLVPYYEPKEAKHSPLSMTTIIFIIVGSLSLVVATSAIIICIARNRRGTSNTQVEATPLLIQGNV